MNRKGSVPAGGEDQASLDESGAGISDVWNSFTILIFFRLFCLYPVYHCNKSSFWIE